MWSIFSHFPADYWESSEEDSGQGLCPQQKYVTCWWYAKFDCFQWLILQCMVK